MKQLAVKALRPLVGTSNHAVTTEEFKKAFQEMLEHGPGLDKMLSKEPIAIAVSGGPDSTALCALMKKSFPDRQLIAYMVDHGMESLGVTEEPEKVVKMMKNLDIPCRLLKCDWSDSPLSKLSQGKVMLKAREKRYGQLVEACSQDNVGLMLLGHNLDDDLVTMCYRMARFSGLDGVAGMKPLSGIPAIHPYSEHVLIGRPLLSIEKIRLTETCQELAIDFTNDRSNSFTEYSRNLILRSLSELQDTDDQRYSTQRLFSLLKSFKRHQQALHDRIVKNMNESVLVNRKQGTALIVANNLASLSDRPVWTRILSYLFQYASAQMLPSRTVSLNDLLMKLTISCREHQELNVKRQARLPSSPPQYTLPPLPSDKTGRVQMGSVVMGGCIVYPLARADSALRIQAARAGEQRSVEFGPAFLIQRERPKLAEYHPQAITLPPGHKYLWDGRIWIHFSGMPADLKLAISPLRPEDASEFIKLANRSNGSAAKRSLLALKAVTPGNMLYNMPFIRIKSADHGVSGLDYMALPLAGISIGPLSMVNGIKWHVQVAGESTLLTKFRCVP